MELDGRIKAVGELETRLWLPGIVLRFAGRKASLAVEAVREQVLRAQEYRTHDLQRKTLQREEMERQQLLTRS